MLKYIFKTHLNLHYDKSIVDEIDEDIPATSEKIEFDRVWDDYLEKKGNLAQKRLDLFLKNIPSYMLNMKNSIIDVCKTIM